jgi:ABC-type transport system involved in Fe-S cluster assembly fused permease/ATPase subunit
MIAHRLSTIASAQNLLYLEDNTKLISASKGTKEYEDIIERLMSNNYAH